MYHRYSPKRLISGDLEGFLGDWIPKDRGASLLKNRIPQAD